MLATLGFTPDEYDGALITIDKLDKIAQDGVLAELRERGYTPAAVDALESFFRRPMTMEFLPFGEAAIRKALPDNPDPDALAGLVAIGEAVTAARGTTPDEILLQFDPFLVRGMGYYTGPIFELAHPSVEYSLGGGGRYDGMIGRFLGTEVPATGFSLGFERLVELVEPNAEAGADAIALLHDAETPADGTADPQGGPHRAGRTGATRRQTEEHQADPRGPRDRRLHQIRVRRSWNDPGIHFPSSLGLGSGR